VSDLFWLSDKRPHFHVRHCIAATSSSGSDQWVLSLTRRGSSLESDLAPLPNDLLGRNCPLGKSQRPVLAFTQPDLPTFRRCAALKPKFGLEAPLMTRRPISGHASQRCA